MKTLILIVARHCAGTIAFRDVDHAKWRLWHELWQGCLIKLARLSHWTEVESIRHIEGVMVLRHHLHELIAYLEANQAGLVNYGARRRHGDSISTAFVESAANEIVARRMIKKQQMRWNRWTVQPFLDVRVAVLDGALKNSFRKRCPEFRQAKTQPPAAAPA